MEARFHEGSYVPIVAAKRLLLTFPSSLFVMFRNMEHFHWTGQRSACSKRAWRVALILSFCAFLEATFKPKSDLR